MTLADFSNEFRKHHRLILWGGLVVVLYLAFLKGAGTLSHIYELRAAVDQNQVLADAKAAKAASDQQAKDTAEYAKWKSDSDAKAAVLRGQLADVQKSVQAQQAKDRVLSSPELADRLSGLVGVPDGYKPAVDGLTASLVAGQSTVVLLDELQGCRATTQANQGIMAQMNTDLDKRQTLIN